MSARLSGKQRMFDGLIDRMSAEGRGLLAEYAEDV
jgi:hypothetical protein